MVKTRLVMTFVDALGQNISMSLDDPRADITEGEITAAMNLIVAKNVFKPKGADLVGIVEAKIIATDTTEFELA
jgi:Protein of unknown function (DUF2922)